MEEKGKELIEKLKESTTQTIMEPAIKFFAARHGQSLEKLNSLPCKSVSSPNSQKGVESTYSFAEMEFDESFPQLQLIMNKSENRTIKRTEKHFDHELTCKEFCS